MKFIHEMLIRMYTLAVWDNKGKLYLPIFDSTWDHVIEYRRGPTAIKHNSSLWIQDHPNVKKSRKQKAPPEKNPSKVFP